MSFVSVALMVCMQILTAVLTVRSTKSESH